MNEIDLRRFDLNLLAVFEVLMRERSVTRAAERLGRTQSAVSHSLSRLRDQLGDPLLIKGGRRMEPTAVALEFIEQVRPLLRGIERVLSPRHRFEPTRSRRVFRLAAPDFALALFTDLLAGLPARPPLLVFFTPLAPPRHARHAPYLRSRVRTRAFRHRSHPACHAVQRGAGQGSRDRLVAQSAWTAGEEQVYKSRRLRTQR